MELLVIGSFVWSIVVFFAVMKIFTISANLEKLNKTMADFTKYYYELQNFNLAKARDITSVPVLDKPPVTNS